MNFSNNTYDIITDNRSIPYNVAGTGTILTEGIAVVGVGTSFLSELQAGSVLVDLTQWEWRKVVNVENDLLAYIEKPFTIDIAALTTPEIIHKSKRSVVEISLEIKTANPAGLLDNKAFSGGITLSKADREGSAARDFIDPIIVDATGTFINVSLIY